MQQIIEADTNLKSTFFLFINSLSGSGQGTKLLKPNISKISFLLEDQQIVEGKFDSSLQRPVDVYFVDLLNAKKRQAAFKRLKNITLQLQTNIRGRQSQYQKVYIMIGGGDGTIAWILEEMELHKVPFEKVPVTPIPIGTGNDMCQFLGWSRAEQNLSNQSYKKLKLLIREWMAADQEHLDVWEVRANACEYGYFEVVNSTTRESQKLDGLEYRRLFVDYFSFGIDGKIGYNFDIHRTGNRNANFLVYTVMGMVKMLTPTRTINELVSDISVIEEKSQGFLLLPYKQEQDKYSVQSRSENELSLTSRQYLRPILSSSLSHSNKKPSNLNQSNLGFQKQSLTKILQSTYYTILAQNINSFMAGTRNIWQNSSDSNQSEHGNGQQEWHRQSSKDSMIEFIGFKSTLDLALQNTVHGLGQKLAQGQGPFLINFQEKKEGQDIKKHRTYLQMDGEYVRFTGPKTLLIKRWRQIKVLRKRVEVLHNQRKKEIIEQNAESVKEEPPHYATEGLK